MRTALCRAVTEHLRYLRLKPFPITDEDGPEAERYRRATLGALSTAISRLIGFALIAFSVHWSAAALGHDRFGIWATFSSVAIMLSFLDLGVGNALINRVAEASASDDRVLVSSVVTGGLLWLITAGLAAALLLAIASVWIPWSDFFRLHNAEIAKEAREAALVYSLIFGLNIVSTGLLKILVGQQRTHEAQLIDATGTLIACPVIWLTSIYCPRVSTFLVAGIGIQSAISAVLVLSLLYRRKLLDHRLAWASLLSERKPLFSISSLFMCLQIGTMVGWGADSFIIAGIGGAYDVAIFAVSQRLFLFASQPVSIMNGALWAAYADAYARKDGKFLKKTLLRAYFAGMLVVLLIAFFLLLYGQRMAGIWTRNVIIVPQGLILAFAVWTPLEAAGSILSTYLNGVGIVREQVIVVICFCLVALPSKIYLGIHAGATGLVAATAAAYALSVVGLYTTVLRKRVLSPLEQFSDLQTT